MLGDMPGRSRLPGLARHLNGEMLTWAATAALALLGSLYVAPAVLLRDLVAGLTALAPAVAVAALLAGAAATGSWSERVLAVVRGGPARAILLASVAGAITPVCGLGILPLIAALLRRGLPLAPVMAFWVASPVMGPSMVVVTVSVLGPGFAVAKALAALGVGLLAGTVTQLVPRLDGPGRSVMRPGYQQADRCGVGSFWREVLDSVRLVTRWLALALVLEVLIQRLVPGAWIASLFGTGAPASVPLAAVVGAPLYVDGYAALPLVRGLMDLGMGFGPALAFMISGAAVSIYAAVAVAALVRARVFWLYVALAVAGAMAAGWVADALVARA